MCVIRIMIVAARVAGVAHAPGVLGSLLACVVRRGQSCRGREGLRRAGDLHIQDDDGGWRRRRCAMENSRRHRNIEHRIEVMCIGRKWANAPRVFDKVRYTHVGG